MSSDAAAAALSDVLPAGFVLTGGIPLKHPDFAASIVFVIAYLLLIPAALFRIIRPTSRTTVLVRPAIFLVARVGTYVVRAIQANGNYSTGLFIAEQILMLCGFQLLCAPLVSLVKYQTYQGWIPTGQKGSQPFELITRLLDVALTVAIILGIVVGSEISDAKNNVDTANALRDCRWANGIISTIVVAISILLVFFMHTRQSMPLRSTLYVVAIGALLLVPCVYKLVIYAHPPSPISTGSKVAFYFFFALPEWLVDLAYFGINLQETFDIAEGTRKEKWEKAARKGKVQGEYMSESESDGEGRSYQMKRTGGYPVGNGVRSSRAEGGKV
ncbi:hypothetical protein JCM1840_006131 [Sporobolomyces johnsonii]